MSDRLYWIRAHGSDCRCFICREGPTLTRYQVYVKWRLITPPHEEMMRSGKPLAEVAGEDVYHPDKMIAVGQPFERREDAVAYAVGEGWKAGDWEIR